MGTYPDYLLTDLDNLRRRTREARRGYWLPLLFFGVVILAAPLVYRPQPPPAFGTVTSFLEPGTVRIGGVYLDPLGMFSGFMSVGDPLVVGLYWLGVTIAGMLVTLAWYRWRARRIGLLPRTGTFLLAMLAALIVPLVVPQLLGYVLPVLGLYSAATLWIGIGLFVAGATAGVLASRGRLPRWPGLIAGGIVMLVGAGMIAQMSTTHGFTGLLVIAVGVLALAWMERSPLCSVIAGLFAATALLANLYNMENIAIRLFGSAGNQYLVTLSDVLLPGLVLLIGAVAGWINGLQAE